MWRLRSKRGYVWRINHLIVLSGGIESAEGLRWWGWPWYVAEIKTSLATVSVSAISDNTCPRCQPFNSVSLPMVATLYFVIQSFFLSDVPSCDIAHSFASSWKTLFEKRWEKNAFCCLPWWQRSPWKRICNIGDKALKLFQGRQVLGEMMIKRVENRFRISNSV